MQLKSLLACTGPELDTFVTNRREARKLTLNRPVKRATIAATASAWGVPTDVLTEKLLALRAEKEIQ